MLCVYRLERKAVELIGVETYDDFDRLGEGCILETDVAKVLDYACAECGFTVGFTEAETIEWLKKKGMIQDNDDI